MAGKNELFPAKWCAFGNVQADGGQLLTRSRRVYVIHLFLII